MRKMHSFQNKMRDTYLSFSKYLFQRDFRLYPLIILYRKYLINEGAYSTTLTDLVKKIQALNAGVGNFCCAEVSFLQGNFKRSLDILTALKLEYPENSEIHYLIYKNYVFLGESYKADQILYELLIFSKRKKTWLHLANNVSSERQFLNFSTAFFKKNDIQKKMDIQLFNYYSEAALRSNNYQAALDIWILFIKNIKQSHKIKPKKYFDQKNAEHALLCLKEILDHANVPFFLVSGTLLGCIRNKSILPHDKDLDIGVFSEDIDKEKIIKLILRSGFFEILPTRIVQQVKLKHHNGTYIDVFIHDESGGYFWHYAAKIKWFNTPFKLKKIKFLDTDFYIPEDTNRYLIENYGKNWKVPQVDFDSNFDTPNAVVSNYDEMQVFYVRMLAFKYLHGDINSRSFKKVIESLSNEVIACLKQESILIR